MSKTIGQLAAEKRKLQDTKTKLDNLYKEKATIIAKQLAIVDADIMKIFNETGQTSAKTEAGTVFRQESVRVGIDNFDAFCNWVLESGRVDALQKRVSSTVVKELLDDGEKVQGVSLTSYYKINLRGK